MAIIRSMGVGKASGSIDNITYSTVQGRTIARSKPAFVHNPNTSLQRAQRLRMRDVVFLWRVIGRQFEKLWTKRARYNSPYNAFVSKNIMNDDTYLVDVLENDYELIPGFVLGEGIYLDTDMTMSEVDGELVTTINPLSPLGGALKVGDVIGCAFFDQSGVLIDVTETLIRESQLEKENLPFTSSNPLTPSSFDLIAPYWYSPSRKQSTTCIVKRVV